MPTDAPRARLPRRVPRSARDDAGSALAGFLLVSVLVTVMFLGVIQVAVVLHVRSTLTDSAAEGARYAARADRVLDDGANRARELAAAALSSAYASDVEARYVGVADARMVEVTVSAPLPVIGLWGPGRALTTRGHALVEEMP